MPPRLRQYRPLHRARSPGDSEYWRSSCALTSPPGQPLSAGAHPRDYGAPGTRTGHTLPPPDSRLGSHGPHTLVAVGGSGLCPYGAAQAEAQFSPCPATCGSCDPE